MIDKVVNFFHKIGLGWLEPEIRSQEINELLLRKISIEELTDLLLINEDLAEFIFSIKEKIGEDLDEETLNTIKTQGESFLAYPSCKKFSRGLLCAWELQHQEIPTAEVIIGFMIETVGYNRLHEDQIKKLIFALTAKNFPSILEKDGSFKEKNLILVFRELLRLSREGRLNFDTSSLRAYFYRLFDAMHYPGKVAKYFREIDQKNFYQALMDVNTSLFEEIIKKAAILSQILADDFGFDHRTPFDQEKIDCCMNNFRAKMQELEVGSNCFNMKINFFTKHYFSK